MDDPGSNNTFVGHRRWILYPPTVKIGSGSVPATGGPAANALWVIGGFGTRPATPAWVAWPPRGYLPYQLLPKTSGRWSFSYAGANFSNAAVTMTQGGANVALTVEPQMNDEGYADNTLVWKPQGVATTKPASDVVYTVTIKNVVVGGKAQNFSYDVTIIDADRPVVSASRQSGSTNIILSWPTNFAGYSLQSALICGTSSTWSAVGGVPQVIGPNYQVTVSPSNNPRFYRLGKP
jgi:hypothetical protein